MNEVRVAWNVVGRPFVADEPILGGLWHPPPRTRKHCKETLIIAMESGNETCGPDSHWIEERQA